MPRRGENIRKRKDGRWEGRYKKGTTNDGRTRYISVYGKTYHEVKDKLLLAIRNNTPLPKASVTFGELLQSWKINNKARIKGSTEAKYDYLIEKHILPELGSVKVNKISSAILSDYVNKKINTGRLDNQGGLSASYIRTMILIINSALKYGVSEQICEPLRTPIPKPAVSTKELQVLSVSDQSILESYLINNIDNTNLGILLSINTGMRIGEICALSWNDIDFENEIIHIRTTLSRIKNEVTNSSYMTKLVINTPKTKAPKRDIPIPKNILPILKQMSICSQSCYVVSNKPDAFVSTRTFEYRYRRTIHKSGLEYVNFHVLRHTFATRCIEVGVDVKTLSEILGHTNVSVTLNTYVHSSIELKRKQLEKLYFQNN